MAVHATSSGPGPILPRGRHHHGHISAVMGLVAKVIAVAVAPSFRRTIPDGPVSMVALPRCVTSQVLCQDGERKSVAMVASGVPAWMG